MCQYIYFRVLGLKSNTFSLKIIFSSFHIEHLTVKLSRRTQYYNVESVRTVEKSISVTRHFDNFILDRTLSFQYVKVNYLRNHLKIVSLIYYMVSEINILKTQFVFIGCHNPVIQQSSEINISSKEIPHIK